MLMLLWLAFVWVLEDRIVWQFLISTELSQAVGNTPVVCPVAVFCLFRLCSSNLSDFSSYLSFCSDVC